MNAEINPTPEIDEAKERTFREITTERLLNDHNDLPEHRLNRWLELLNDECGGDRVWAAKSRVMAATAVWTMMDVRDGPTRAIEARKQYLSGFSHDQ